MRTTQFTQAGRVLLVLALAVGIAGCDTKPGLQVAGTDAAAGPGAAPDGFMLQRVVMLMRHGVRPPTKEHVTPEGVADKPWPAWPVGFGELTPHGHDAVALLGAWDRGHLVKRGLLAASGCPGDRDIAISASYKSRTQATAHALIGGLAPGCTIDVAFPASAEDDVLFHPLDAGAMPFDPEYAYRATIDELPADGLEGEVQRNGDLFALLDRAFDCCTGDSCPVDGKPRTCALSRTPAGIKRKEGDAPAVGNPFGIASTVSQTFLLEYLEGKPMEEVAWGRLSREEIGRLLEFHAIKFRYEARTPYTAERAASPLAARMLEALENGPRLTVLVGHDTNVANLGGFLDVHWKVPDYPADDPPPGGALGFELLADTAGKQVVRAFYRSQTMDQVRELQALDGGNAPAYLYLPIPGCSDPCLLQDFARLVRAKLITPKASAAPVASAEATTPRQGSPAAGPSAG